MPKMIAILTIALLTAGCSPVIDARLRLIDVSRQGLSALGESVDDRRRLADALYVADRKRLDTAFDADARRQSPLTDAWVVEARVAYAAALDAFAERRRRSGNAADADRANVAAIDSALAELQALDRSQLKLTGLFGGSK